MNRRKSEFSVGFDGWQDIKKTTGLIMKITLAFFVFGLLLSGLSMIIKPAFLYGDRVITKMSFQYTEGKAQEMLALHQDFIGLHSRVMEARTAGNEQLATALETQQSAIKTEMCNLAHIATLKSAVPEPVRLICGL